MPTRALACAIDVVLQGIVLVVLISLLAGFLIGGQASEALAAALIFIVVLLVVIGYRVVMETLTRGRTLGKMVLGLKVVRDDGSSIRFRQALVRSLLWFFVDFAPWFAACPGIVASLMNKQGKRFGDMVSGTVVIRERHQPMASPPLFVPGHLVQWAQSLELSRLSDDLANASRDYLARYTELQPDARTRPGRRPGLPHGCRHRARPTGPPDRAGLPLRRTGRTPPPRTQPPGHPTPAPRPVLRHPSRPLRPTDPVRRSPGARRPGPRTVHRTTAVRRPAPRHPQSPRLGRPRQQRAVKRSAPPGTVGRLLWGDQ